MIRLLPPFSILASASLLGCGKPPPPPGPPMDMPVAVVVAEVMEEVLEDSVFVVGSLTSPDETAVVAEVSGQLTALRFDKGDPLDAGDELVRIEDAKIRARMADASARLALARTEHERMHELRTSGTATQQELDVAVANLHTSEAAVRLLEEELADTVVTAPFTGVVATRDVSPGQFVNAGQSVATLVRMDPLEIAFDLPERHIGRIEAGRVVRITTPAFPGERFEGTVSYLSPGLDERTRTLRVEATLPNPDHRLRPGMFGNAELVLGRKERALLIPSAALRYRGDDVSVVVRNANGAAEFRPVRTGTRLDQWVEIVEGLEAREQVVVEGHLKIFAPGTVLSIAPESTRYGIAPPPPVDAAAAPASDPAS